MRPTIKPQQVLFARQHEGRPAPLATPGKPQPIPFASTTRGEPSCLIGCGFLPHIRFPALTSPALGVPCLFLRCSGGVPFQLFYSYVQAVGYPGYRPNPPSPPLRSPAVPSWQRPRQNCGWTRSALMDVAPIWQTLPGASLPAGNSAKSLRQSHKKSSMISLLQNAPGPRLVWAKRHRQL